MESTSAQRSACCWQARRTERARTGGDRGGGFPRARAPAAARRKMARRVLRASTLCFSTLVLAWCLPSVGAQMLKGRPPRDGQVAPQKGGGVIASSLDASPRAGAAAGGVEDKLTLLAGEVEPSGEATSDAVNEKIRKAFNSKSSGGDTSAAESAASAVVTNQLQQPAAEQHGNTRRVMGSDTPPPVAAGASAALDETKPKEKEEKDVKINAANEAPKAEAKKEAPKRAEGPVSERPCLRQCFGRRPVRGVVCAQCQHGTLMA